MKNSKKLFLIFLSVLTVAFVSCKKDSGGSITTPTPTFKLSSLEGTWEEIKDANPDTFTIDGQGKISGSIDGKAANITIENWDATKEVTQVTVTQNIPSQSSGNTDLIFTFKDGNSCTVQVKGSQGITPKNFTKKATAK